MAKTRSTVVLKVMRPRVACTIRIDAELEDEITLFEQRLKNEAPRFVFDRNRIVEDALREALDQARVELATMMAEEASPDATARTAP
jgi:hypothetical protein